MNVSATNVYAGLTEVFHEAFGDNSMVLEPGLAAEDVLGWDSVMMVTIILAVEQRFNVMLESHEVDGLRNVGDLADLLATKVS